MADELAYVMITPYSLHKSRTGGIIGRLVSLAKLDLWASTCTPRATPGWTSTWNS